MICRTCARNIFKTVLFAAVILLCIAKADVRADSALNSERRVKQAKKIVAMISGEFKDAPCVGTGIVFGAANNRLYIATARHIVRKDPNFSGESAVEDAHNIKVEFSQLPGEKFTAKLLSDYREAKETDLAVLVVTHAESLGLTRQLFPFAIIDENTDMAWGDSLHAITHEKGQKWSLNAIPFKFKKKRLADYEFEATNLPPGSSGGALFTTDLKLIGMIKRSNLNDGIALRIDSMTAILKNWGLPVSLRQWRAKDALGIKNTQIITLTKKSRFFHPDGLSFSACDICKETVVFCDRWVHELEDLKDKRVRIVSLKEADNPDILQEVVTAAGGKPFKIPFAELYPSLEKGVIQCVMTDVQYIDRLP
ncbi:hypothetical protein DSCW_32050 [Desulfosarcina widdelii]|uniref:Serine protease n=1 Tax=Desulfosarcina widdelii TaxID=947919 RepID=A0A5K7Z480_9BACT|nr:serine protease [Desulfosarcina widdelii]BBO75788.1 hypothetical protein DSCW_32050 [Desulfosarcina widdelii]